MRNRAAQALAVGSSAILVLFLFRNAPLLSNRDDFLRLYFGGYVGCVSVRGGAPADLVRREIAAAEKTFGNELRASRFKVAQTPYSPLTLALVCGAEGVRARLPDVDLATWALGIQTASWLALLAGAAMVARRQLPGGPRAWFLVVGLSLVWMHVHTTPFLPSPRAIAGLATGLALALVITGRGEPWAHACVVVGALSHPYNQAINLAIAAAFVPAVAGTRATAGWRPGMALRVALTAGAALALALAVVNRVNPRAAVAVDELWGYHELSVLTNWAANRPAVYRLLGTVGLPLAALVLRYAGAGRAALAGMAFALTVAAPAFLWPAGLYPGEVTNRVGGAWVAALFALCLRGDLLPDLSRTSARGRVATVTGVLVVAGAGAVPEALGIRNAPHYVPWRRQARVETLPGVERECLSIIARTSRP